MSKIIKATALKELFKSVIEKKNNQQNFDVSAGSSAVDSVIGGLRFGELIVIGARPAMGKTKFLLKSLLRISKNVPVLLISIENNQKRIANKLVSIKKDGGVTFFINNVIDFVEDYDFEKEKLLISDKVFESIEEYILLIIHHVQNDGVKVIAVDDLELLPEGSSKLKNVEILKELCHSLKVTIITTSLVKRECESRMGDKKPRLKDLNVIPSFHSLFDVVLLLYRPEYYGFLQDENGNSTAGKLEVIIAKNRENEPFGFGVDCLFYDIEDNDN